MTPEKAFEIAAQKVAQDYGRPLRPMGGATRAGRDPMNAGRWVVVFEFTTPEGGRCDGPIVVWVDDKSGEVDYLTSL